MPELWVPWARCSVGLGVRGDSPLVFPVGVVTGIELGGKAHPVWCHLWSPVHIWPAVSGPAVCTSWGSPVLRQMLLLPLPSLQWTPIGVRRHQSFWEKHIHLWTAPAAGSVQLRAGIQGTAWSAEICWEQGPQRLAGLGEAWGSSSPSFQTKAICLTQSVFEMHSALGNADYTASL